MSSVCVGVSLHAASCLENGEMKLAVILLPIKLTMGNQSTEAEGILSVGGRDLALDLTDLLTPVVARYFVEY